MCQLNWKVIADNLNSKIKLMNDLTSLYSNVDVSRYNFSFKDGMNLGMSIVGTGMALSNIGDRLSGKGGKTPTEKLKAGLQKEKIIKVEVSI